MSSTMVYVHGTRLFFIYFVLITKLKGIKIVRTDVFLHAEFKYVVFAQVATLLVEI